MSVKFKADYEKMYAVLAVEASKAIDEIIAGNYLKAKCILEKAERECEDIFCETYVEFKIDDGIDRYL